MVVIIKKENGKAVFNMVNVNEKERMNAQKLDLVLSKIGPLIEEKWIKERMLKGGGRKIDIKLAYQIGKILSRVVDNERLVSPNERKWVWKAMREMYLKNSIIIKRGETRDDLEYLYKVSKYPYKLVKNISWDGWRRLLDSPSIRQDERFEEWFQRKVKNLDIIKRGFIRKFTKDLYSLIKNKDTTVLSEKEISDIYESAWNSAMTEK